MSTEDKSSNKHIDCEKIEETKKERNKYWDIVKGVGILSIVIGHVCCPVMLRKFVYTFHLVIFYFVAAYFYNENKYGDKPSEYFITRFKNMWIKYFLYSTALVLLHNFFFKYNFYTNMNQYTFSDLLVNISKNLIFASGEPFTAALWFVATLIIANGLFAVIVYISRKISLILNKEKNKQYIKYISIVIITFLVGSIGVFLNNNKLEILYQVHTSLLILPIYTLAYFSKIILTKYNKRIKDVKWYIYLILSILSAFFLYLIISKKGMEIELAQEQINGYMFYIISIIGICFCLSISKVIEKISFISNIMSVVGKRSFTIMALHLVCIKPLEILYVYIMNEANLEIIKRLLILNSNNLWMIYAFVGVSIPTLISIVLDIIKNKIKKQLQQKA